MPGNQSAKLQYIPERNKGFGKSLGYIRKHSFYDEGADSLRLIAFILAEIKQKNMGNLWLIGNKSLNSHDISMNYFVSIYCIDMERHGVLFVASRC